jgi:glycine cleavage system aminomethyltransferase T
MLNKNWVGQITTAVWSPRLRKNIAIGMVQKSAWELGQELIVKPEGGQQCLGIVTTLPFD